MSAQSWASCEFSILKEGKPATLHIQLAGVSFDDTLETALVHGAGRDPIDLTDGVYMPGEMTIDMYTKWCRVWMADVTDNGAQKLGDQRFRLVLKRRALSDTGEQVDQIDFAVTGLSDSGASGSSEATKTAVKCQCIKIVRNGVQL